MRRVREKRRVEERRAEDRRSEKRKSQKKEDAGARKGRKVAGTGVTFAPERGSHSPLNQKGSHSPLNHKTFNVVLNPLGLNLGTRGTGEPLGGTWGHMVTCLSIQYVAQPFRVKPGDKGTWDWGTFRGDLGAYGNLPLYSICYSTL